MGETSGGFRLADPPHHATKPLPPGYCWNRSEGEITCSLYNTVAHRRTFCVSRVTIWVFPEVSVAPMYLLVVSYFQWSRIPYIRQHQSRALPLVGPMALFSVRWDKNCVSYGGPRLLSPTTAGDR